MGKTLQSKKDRMRNRFKTFVAADYLSYSALHKAVQERLGETVNYPSFLKVMSGDFISGPKAERIMKTVSELVKKKIETLWPELKGAA